MCLQGSTETGPGEKTPWKEKLQEEVAQSDQQRAFLPQTQR